MEIESVGIEYLASLEPWRGQGGFSLEVMRRLMNHLGNPQDKPKSVHVAGTNGKGSVACAVASILGAVGYRVGLNTSPHLTSMNERIVIDGFPISNHELGKAAYRIKAACEKISVAPTFHEAITAVAFLIFEGLDWSVIEVGLGGRLDASNILTSPKISVITSIDFDHEHILGNTIKEIAAEKAGIIKTGSTVVVGLVPEEAANVISRIAKERGAQVFFAGKDFRCSKHKEKANQQVEDFEFYGSQGSRFYYSPSLSGDYQGENMAVALQVAELLSISSDIAKLGISRMFWPGRLEMVRVGDSRVLLECAHNPHGVAALTSFLESEGLGGLDIGFGALNTKRWREMIDMLIPYVGNWHLLTSPSSMGVPSEVLADYLISKGIKAKGYGKAFDEFVAHLTSSSKLSLVTGSIYLVGAVRSRLGVPIKPLWIHDGYKK